MAASRRLVGAALLRAAAPAAPRVSSAAGARATLLASRSHHARQPFPAPRGPLGSSLLSRSYLTESNAPSEGRQWDHAAIKDQIKTHQSLDEGAATKESRVIFVDVREPEELRQTGKIPGAINIPITSAVQSFHISDEDFSELYGYDRPPKDAELMFYCKAGVRARSAAGLAQHAGWSRVGVYKGSWLDWEAQDGPVERVGAAGEADK